MIDVETRIKENTANALAYLDAYDVSEFMNEVICEFVKRDALEIKMLVDFDAIAVAFKRYYLVVAQSILDTDLDFYADDYSVAKVVEYLESY